VVAVLGLSRAAEPSLHPTAAASTAQGSSLTAPPRRVNLMSGHGDFRTVQAADIYELSLDRRPYFGTCPVFRFSACRQYGCFANARPRCETE
jgi:hypothetical protein